MRVVGLTGSIGMGKSTAARLLRGMGVPVHDADAAVHRLLGPGGGAVAAVERLFPGTRRGDRIDRRALGDRVLEHAAALRRLESVLHPLVHRLQRRFLRRARVRGHRLAVLDIPLLFETGAERRCDAVIVVCAPAFLQRQRVLPRPGMTPDRLAAIRARQLSDAEKRKRADAVVWTGGTIGATRRALARALRRLRRRRIHRPRPPF